MDTAITSTGSSRKSLLRRALLLCGVFSSLVYVGADIFAAMQYEGYSYTDQHISELSAVGAPTRPLMVSLGITYTVLGIAFALGVWASAGRNRAMRITGALLFGYGVVNLSAPFFSMHLRGTEGITGDAMHLILTGITVSLIVLIIGFGAAAMRKRFRIYSILTLVILLLFGAWAGSDASAIATGLSTPWSGIKERINIYASMLWVLVFAIALLRAEKEQAPQVADLRTAL